MVQVVDRTLDVIEVLADARDALSVSEIAMRLQLPASTIHRLLHVLVERGYAVQDENTRRYAPGPKMIEIPARAIGNSRFDLRRVAYPRLQELAQAYGESSNLVIVQGFEGVYLDQVPGSHLIQTFAAVGGRVPLYCTGVGKAILSGFSLARLHQYLVAVTLTPWTVRSITSPIALRGEIERVRDRGYATDDEEREAGVRCVAAPLFSRVEECVGAISVSGPTMRVRDEDVAMIGAHIRRLATECSVQLGYRPRLSDGEEESYADAAG